MGAKDNGLDGEDDVIKQMDYGLNKGDDGLKQMVVQSWRMMG